MSKRNIGAILAACAMAIIILDTKVVIIGTQEGIKLSLQTIIPALFPFIILSGIINSCLLGQTIKFLLPLSRLCKIPKGAESLLMLGFLGGYPVGAQAISQAYAQGSLTKNTAQRMLGFCNNAGPAFIFGMFSVIFSRPIILWVLWIIHILSGITVGLLLPGEELSDCKIKISEPMSVPKALQNAIKTTSIICGWVVIFRIIISFCDKWLFWMLPVEMQVAFSGFLELSNGCVLLQKIQQEASRFLLASVFLAFGGICIGMQTKSVTENLGCGFYFSGKILQTHFALLYSLILQPFLYKNVSIITNTPLLITLILLIGIQLYLLHRKKLWHLRNKYSIILSKIGRKEQLYAVSKKNNTFLQLLPTWHRHR